MIKPRNTRGYRRTPEEIDQNIHYNKCIICKERFKSIGKIKRKCPKCSKNRHSFKDTIRRIKEQFC